MRVEIMAERDMPEGVAVLRGARVITMRGDEVIENADIVVRNNRIEAVGASGSVTVPDGAEVIDVAGKTIVPGFVDTHAHLRPPFGIHKTQVWEYLANLAYGVTTTRDPQTGTTDVLTYSDLVDTGALAGPRIYSTGPGVFQSEQVRDQDHADDILRRYSDYYDTKTLKMYVSGNRQQRQWLIKASREHEIMPTTEGALDLKLNLTQIIDGYPGHEHNFPIYPLYKDVIELVKQAGTTYTPTLLVTYGGPWGENYFYTTENVHGDAKLARFTPHDQIDQRVLQRPWFHEMRTAFQDHAKFVADLVEAGGKAGVGSHGQLQGLGYHWELWAMQSGGLPEHDALRVATLFGAQGIGLDQDVGSIEAGKLADLVVLNANPLDNIRNTNTIRYVMKNGRLYDGNTLNEVYPRQQDLGPLWWEGRTPDAASMPGVMH
ncbi:MAG TPA: amidohydrolase family protein, partial [Rhodothermales bacterium]|nr:amidohydrolase family protein [Rhodothermales bacterium]